MTSLRCAVSVTVSRQHSVASLERAETSFTSEQPLGTEIDKMFTQYRIKIKGTLTHHPSQRSGRTRRRDRRLTSKKKALTKKKGANRTDVEVSRIRELECEIALYVTADGKPTISASRAPAPASKPEQGS